MDEPFKEGAAATALYARSPLAIHKGIPVFSATDAYIENYDRISGDHLHSLDLTGKNPWIIEHLWIEFEESTAALIEKYARPGQRILDVGVGLGRLLERFPELERHGMDISAGYLERTKGKGIEVCLSKVEDMPYQDETFDLIVCTDVLEHVFDLTLACRKILAVLKPGGFLILRAPYREDLSGYLAADYPYDFVHIRTFDEAGLRLHFEKTLGVQVLETSLAGHYINAARRKREASNFDEATLNRLYSGVLPDKLPFVAPVLLRDRYEPIEINAVISKNISPGHTIMNTLAKPSERIAERLSALETELSRITQEYLTADGSLQQAQHELQQLRQELLQTQGQLAVAQYQTDLARQVAQQQEANHQIDIKGRQQRITEIEGWLQRREAQLAEQREKERGARDKADTSKHLLKLRQAIASSSWLSFGMAFRLCRPLAEDRGKTTAEKLTNLQAACQHSCWARLGAKLGFRGVRQVLDEIHMRRIG